ncbi:hypothetical protein XENTR_v10014235 [Xenopus tropicalis]|nr:hypothetical protein XENTR_v10014235 [Xenopus tropicalis]
MRFYVLRYTSTYIAGSHRSYEHAKVHKIKGALNHRLGKGDLQQSEIGHIRRGRGSRRKFDTEDTGKEDAILSHSQKKHSSLELSVFPLPLQIDLICLKQW